MFKKTFLCFIFCCIYNFSYAQWYVFPNAIGPIFYSGNMLNIYSLPQKILPVGDGKILYAVTFGTASTQIQHLAK